MPRIVEPGRVARQVAVYGEPKSWKTRLVTSLPWGETWGEKAIYVAADPGAASLQSVLEENKKRLTVVVPEPKEGRLDLHTEYFAIASRDWKKEVPEAGTIIWDTMSATARELLGVYADSGVFSTDKHVAVGTPRGVDYVAQPMQGDYAVAQRATMQLLGWLMRQKLNLIVVFHAELADADATPSYGPKTVGKATVRDVGGLFDNLLRTDVTERAVGGTPPRMMTEGRVHTQKKGLWMAGVRTPHPENPMPVFVLPPNPVTFWMEFDKVTGGAK